MFEPTTLLVELIDKKDLLGIHGILTLIANKDRSFSTNDFMDAMEYVKKQNIPDFIVPFDGRRLESKENWTEEYWETILASLNFNFSEERINHLKEISAYLYPRTNVSEIPAQKNNTENKIDNDSPSSSNQGTSDTKKNPTLAAVAGAAVMCVAALAIESKKLSAMAWMGAVALGGYAVYTLMKRD